MISIETKINFAGRRTVNPDGDGGLCELSYCKALKSEKWGRKTWLRSFLGGG